MSIIALQKEAELDSGAVVNYWKIVGLNYLEFDAQNKVYMAGYVNQEKHDAGAPPAAIKAIELSKAQNDQLRAFRDLPTKEFLYALLSGSPLFKDCVPVLSPKA